MSKILENLYLGSYADARNQVFLKRAEITHIVTVGVELQALYPQHFKYLYIPAYDHPAFQLSPYFDHIADFINNAIEKEKGKVFVHCAMGISRSTTSVIAYLVKYHQMHPLEAGAFVKSRRAIVYPNPGFLRQLDGYAKRLGVVENKSMYKPRASSTMANGFFNNPKKEEEPTKVEMKTATIGFFAPKQPEEAKKVDMRATTNGFFTPKKPEEPKKLEMKTMTNGFFSPKKPEEPKKTEVKTLAMTSSMWRPVTVKELEVRTPSMTISKWKPAIKEEVKTVESEKVKEKEKERESKEYCCKNCGTRLFDSQNIEHDMNTSSSCTTIYIKYMSWMGYSKNTVGKIFCPNGKCNSVLGFSNQNGGKCPCGKRISAMYGVYPMKLGIVGKAGGKSW